MLSMTSRFRSHLSGIGSRSFGTLCAPRAEELQPLNIVKPNEDRRRRSIIECLASRTSDAIEPRLPLPQPPRPTFAHCWGAKHRTRVSGFASRRGTHEVPPSESRALKHQPRTTTAIRQPVKILAPELL